VSIREQQIGLPEAIENRRVIECGGSAAPRCVMQQRLGPTDLETRNPQLNSPLRYANARGNVGDPVQRQQDDSATSGNSLARGAGPNPSFEQGPVVGNRRSLVPFRRSG
jgi:hypothetical protein